MKYLKIENNKGFYSLKKDENKEIDKINKDDLMFLLESAVADDGFEMDPYEDDKLGNKAHQIIYKHLYEKFNEFLQNRDRFKEKVSALYKEAFDKYSIKDNDR